MGKRHHKRYKKDRALVPTVTEQSSVIELADTDLTLDSSLRKWEEKEKKWVPIGGRSREVIVTIEEDETEWDSGLEESHNCPYLTQSVVQISSKVKSQLDYMHEKIKTEFLVYLLGTKEKREGGETIYKITEIRIPEQKVGYSSVDVTEKRNFPILGTLHKHPSSVHNLSLTDHQYHNSKLSLLIVDGKVKGIVRQAMPCGSFLISSVKIEVFYEPGDLKELDSIIEKNIKEETYEYTGRWGYQYGIYSAGAPTVKDDKCPWISGEKKGVQK